MFTTIEAIATGNPETSGTQAYAASFMQRVESLPESIRSRVPQIYERSAIDFRYSCVADYAREPESFSFFPQDWSLQPAPSTARRNQLYREQSVPLAVRVGAEALREAGIAPEEISHVITASCTGFFAPGLDVELVQHLGLSSAVRRTHLGFMGCYAAFPALRLAHSICQSQPGARVLLVCLELCTLHFQIDGSMESAVVNALFSDGAAAAVLASRESPDGRLYYADGESGLVPDSKEAMTWDVGDTGFNMGLSSRVPALVEQELPSFLNRLLDRHGLSPEQVGFWAVHPGGRVIVEKVQALLDLSREDLADSLEVLRLYGNMSSPTILFILKRILAGHASARGRGEAVPGPGVAMAFGPGLTLEAALFRYR